MKTLFTLAVLLAFTSVAKAGVSEFAEINGWVVNFDEKTITLETQSGGKVQVPRKSVKAWNLKPGHYVSAYVKSDKLKTAFKKKHSSS